MNFRIIEQLNQSLVKLDNQYYKQIYVYEYLRGNSVKTFSEQRDFPYINVNLELAAKLLSVAENKRIYKILDFLSEAINSFDSPIVCVDYFELLFDPSLKINPFDLFKSLSRNKILIIAWRGQMDNNYFIHANPGHLEYKKYPIDETLVIK